MEEQSTRAEYRCRSIVGNGAGAGEGATNERSSNGAEGRMHGNVRGENEVEELKSGNNNNNNSSSSFDCNICLESATDPVVTLCGHLFCWPCIYQWLRASHACPVCKAATKEGTLIPLYGGGSAKAGPRNIGIPNRPTHTRTPTPTLTPVIHSYPSPGDYMSHQPYPYLSSSFNHYGLSTGLPPAGYELSPFFAFQCSSVGPSLPHNRHHEAFLEKLFAFVLCFVFVCLISF